MNLATGAFDPGRGYTSPPGLDPPGSRSPAEIRLFGFSPEGGTPSAGGDNHRSGHPPSAKPGGLEHPSWGMAICSSSNLCIGPPGLSASTMHFATGAFDPGRGYTSPPGLDPRVVDLPQRCGLVVDLPQRSGCLDLARRAAHPLPVVITTGLGIHQPPKPGGLAHQSGE